jgi:AraC family transcriptional regulator, arabinose operon regulatory protein
MAALDVSISAIDLATQGVLNLGVVTYPPRGAYGPRVQRDYQLVLLLTGDLIIRIDGQPRHLAPGRVALLRPGHEELFQFAAEEESCHSWVALQRPRLAAGDLSRLDQVPFALPISAAMARLVDLALDLRGGFPKTGSVAAAVVEATLLLYLAEADATPDPAVLPLPHPVVSLVRDHIRRHLAQRLTLGDLAKAVNLSPEHLVRVYTRQTGTTPMRYLWQQRTQQGIFLLRHTGLSVGEIARHTGFRTPYHFARLVRNLAGRSPTSVRQAVWRPHDEPPRS